MSIKFQRFPFLIQRQIIRSMDYHEVVVFSWCSLRIKKIIESIKWNVLRLRYDIYNRHFLIRIGVNDQDIECLIALTADGFLRNSERLRIRNGLEEQVYWYQNKWNENHLVMSLEIMEDLQNIEKLRIHNYICKLFGYSSDVQLQIVCNKHSDDWPNIRNMRDLRTSEKNLEASKVENFFSMSENLRDAVIDHSVSGQLSENSILIEANGLYFGSSGIHAPFLALNFKGSHVVLRGAICDKSVMTQIIMKWISADSFQNLKSLEISLFREHDYFSDVSEDIGGPWDPSKRPESYATRRIMDVIFPPVDCSDFLDIQRSSDGQWASFGISSKCFKFFVWNSEDHASVPLV